MKRPLNYTYSESSILINKLKRKERLQKEIQADSIQYSESSQLLGKIQNGEKLDKVIYDESENLSESSQFLGSVNTRKNWKDDDGEYADSTDFVYFLKSRQPTTSISSESRPDLPPSEQRVKSSGEIEMKYVDSNFSDSGNFVKYLNGRKELASLAKDSDSLPPSEQRVKSKGTIENKDNIDLN